MPLLFETKGNLCNRSIKNIIKLFFLMIGEVKTITVEAIIINLKMLPLESYITYKQTLFLLRF